MSDDVMTAKIRAAYERYDRCYSHARPGTKAASELARARLDLILLLQEGDEPLARELLDQLPHDADALLRTTPALDDQERTARE